MTYNSSRCARTRRWFIVAAIIGLVTPTSSWAETWSATNAGDFLTASNWGGTVPNGVGATATISTNPTNAGNFTLNSPMTVGSIIYSNPQSRSITGTGSLNLAVSSGTPEVSVTGGNLTIATTVTGSQGLNKTGAGTLFLFGSNSFTGTTTISGGWLSGNTIDNIGVNSSFGAGSSFTISNWGTLEYTGSANSTTRTVSLAGGTGQFSVASGTRLTLNGLVSGSGDLSKAGAGMLWFNAANTYSGSTAINAGTVRILASERIPNGSAVSIGASGTLDLNNFNETIGSLTGAGSVTLGNGDLTTGGNNTSTTFSGIISGGGSIIKNGSGTLTLSGSNSNAGTTTINGGTLSGNTIANAGTDSSADSAFGRGSFRLANGAKLQYTGATASTDRTVVLNAGGGAIDVTNAAATLTINNGISGGGGLTKTGDGTLALTDNTNSYSGNTTITGGTLSGTSIADSGSNSAFGRGDFSISNGGTFNYTGANNSTNRTISLTGGTGQVSVVSGTTLTWTNVISGTGDFAKAGDGTLVLDTNTANSYAGTTTINAGTLRLGNSVSIPDGSAVTVVGGGVLDVNGWDEEIGSLAGAGNITLGIGTLHTGGNNASTTVSGTISGSGGLKKMGIGTMTLSGNSTYSNDTYIERGTLSITSGGSLSNGDGWIGYNSGTNSTVTVGGGSGNSTWSNSGIVDVGVFGTGTLNITGGGSVSSLYGYIGDTSTGNGTANVGGGTGSSTWTVSDYMAIGWSGTGALSIQGGGSVSNSLSVVGYQSGSHGTVTVGGGSGNSAWNNSDYVDVGVVGTGTLNIIGGGSVSSLYGFIGDTSTGNGTVNVGGGTGSSTWTVSNEMRIAYFGTGALNITGGGSVSNSYSVVGWQSGSNGMVTVGGGSGNSAWSNSSSVDVGVFGTGTLNIFGGGSVSSSYGVIGDTSTGNGTVNVGGGVGGSVWTITNGLYVGFNGTGTLNLNTGGVVSAAALEGGNPFSSVKFNGGTLRITASDSASNNIHLLAGGGTFDTPTVGTTFIIASPVSGTGSLTKTGDGSLILANSNSYSGPNTISGGVLIGGTIANQGTNSAFGKGDFAISNGATLQYTGSTAATNRTISLGSGGGTVAVTSSGSTLTVSGIVSGAGGLTKLGSGTLELTGANTYSGGTTVSAGTLKGNTTSIQGNVVNNAAVVFEQASAGTYAGTMSGTGNVTKQGAGVVTLTGNNSYSGGTLINGGTLVVNNTVGSGTGSGSVTVNNSGGLAGSGSVAGAVTINSGGKLAPGTSVESLDVGALTFNSGATLDVELDTDASLTAAADLVNADGDLGIFAGAILALTDFGNTLLAYGTKLTLLSYAGTWNGGTFDGYADDSLVTVGVNQYVLNYDDTSVGQSQNFGGGAHVNKVTLTSANTAAVPEASSFIFGTIVCIALAGAHFGRKLYARNPVPDHFDTPAAQGHNIAI